MVFFKTLDVRAYIEFCFWANNEIHNELSRAERKNLQLSSGLNSVQQPSICQNLHWKFGRLMPSFGSILAVRLKKYFFRYKTFLFFKITSWDFQHLFEIKVHKISTHLAYSDNSYFLFFIGFLIELKFCEVSRNSFSNRFWKFQLSTLKNEKVLFLNKIFFRP